MLGRRRPASPSPGAESASGELPAETSQVAVIDDASFFDLTAGGYTVVDFGAGWCAPCRAFAPVFSSVAARHTGAVRFASCDIDASPATAELLQIRSIPTVVVFGPDGSEIGRSSGAVSRGDLVATVADLDNSSL